MKKILQTIACAVLGVCCTVSMLAPANVTAKADDTKIVDIYLIGGQSNAAGYSSTEGVEGEVFNNVMYAGQTDKKMDCTSVGQDWLTFDTFKTNVQLGYGTNSSRMGPEYGMAKYLNDNYSSEHKAFIFKSAAGGTALADVSTGNSSIFGNWYPRSLWEEGYEPVITQATTDPTGVQYKLFVENFRSVYTELVNHGYTPVVKGMAWMQGEEDMGIDCTGYDVLLKQFIADIRTDIYLITRDERTIDMPFVIGNIAPSFAIPNNPGAEIINGLQQSVADKMEYVTTIPADDLIINALDENGNAVVLGTDKYHYNGKDAETLGLRFGEVLLNMETSKNGAFILTGTNGTAAYTYDKEKKILVLKDFVPEIGYALSSVSVNGNVVYCAGRTEINGNPLAQLTDGQIIVDLTPFTDDRTVRYNVSVNFVRMQATIGITNDNESGRVTVAGSLRQEVGTMVEITVTPFSGKEIEQVSFNGVVLSVNERGRYEITVVDGENNFAVVYKDASSSEPSSVPSSDSVNTAGGCGAAMGIQPLAIAAGVLLLSKSKKKKNKQ